MPIPDFQSIMRPLLVEYADGVEWPVSKVRERLAAAYALTPAELEERLPSGRDTTFRNRVGWAVTHLYRTGLLARPRRSVYRITERGQQILKDHPDRVDLRVLDQFPELKEFRSPNSKGADQPEPLGPGLDVLESPPEETIEAAYMEHRQALVAELLDRIQGNNPEFFEQLVLDVLLAMGYGGSRREAGERLGRSGDGGLDGVIREDRLGLDLIYVQAKRWDPGKSVDRPVIQAFVGALQGARASKGVLITSSTFSAGAQQYADTVSPRVILVDGGTLASLMVDHDVGVARSDTYVLKRVDEDYFEVDDVSVGEIDP